MTNKHYNKRAKKKASRYKYREPMWTEEKLNNALRKFADNKRIDEPTRVVSPVEAITTKALKTRGFQVERSTDDQFRNSVSLWVDDSSCRVFYNKKEWDLDITQVAVPFNDTKGVNHWQRMIDNKIELMATFRDYTKSCVIVKIQPLLMVPELWNTWEHTGWRTLSLAHEVPEAVLPEILVDAWCYEDSEYQTTMDYLLEGRE